MKVLITDYAWKSLDPESEILGRAGATLVVAETGTEAELTRLAADVHGILTCWKQVTAPVIRNSPRCLCIGRYGIGLDNIDVACATECGILVTNVPAYCVEEVSDHAMALLLSLARKVTEFDRATKGGRYDLQAGMPLYRLQGRTLGIVGFGKIGRALHRKASSFGLRTLACDPYADGMPVTGVEWVEFPALLQRSDYISLHVPLTPETRGLINDAAIRQMKPTALLINTSRGPVVDGPALLRALAEGRIAGAGLDVLPQEPPAPDDPLIRHPKVIVTPHAAFHSEESVLELQTTAATQMAAVLTGQRPDSIVNPQVLHQPNLRAVLRS